MENARSKGIRTQLEHLAGEMEGNNMHLAASLSYRAAYEIWRNEQGLFIDPDNRSKGIRLLLKAWDAAVKAHDPETLLYLFTLLDQFDIEEGAHKRAQQLAALAEREIPAVNDHKQEQDIKKLRNDLMKYQSSTFLKEPSSSQEGKKKPTETHNKTKQSKTNVLDRGDSVEASGRKICWEAMLTQLVSGMTPKKYETLVTFSKGMSCQDICHVVRTACHSARSDDAGKDDEQVPVTYMDILVGLRHFVSEEGYDVHELEEIIGTLWTQEWDKE